MKRRTFLKYSATTGLTVPFWLESCKYNRLNFPVYINSDYKTGHSIMESVGFPRKKMDDVEIAIVGGGISGMTTAFQLKNYNFQLFELSDRLGGTSQAMQYQNIQFSQGAHYDLAYPENFGENVLQLLEKLEIIYHDSWKKLWSFVDNQHIIPYYRRQRCYDKGKFRREVIAESEQKKQFIALIEKYKDKMPLPTRLIQKPERQLDKINFAHFINQHFSLDSSLKRQLNYHIMDDYGADIDTISALSGILYFACRQYYSQNVPVFSPPTGNAYFIEKLAKHIDKNKIKCAHLVRSISDDGNHFNLEIIDIQQKEIINLRAKQVIYAGQKHALKYVFNDQAHLFENHYAPWMVVNLITKQKYREYGFWQNEYLSGNPNFLGFIDSSVQDQSSLHNYRVFTGYYCFRETDRSYLSAVTDHQFKIVQQTIEYIERMLAKKIEVEAAFIHVMGHAMPIPTPNYLFNDANSNPDAKMIYAGVDNGRLPLLFEALDSGWMAALLAKKNI